MKTLTNFINSLNGNQYLNINHRKTTVYSGKARTYLNTTDFKNQYGNYEVINYSNNGNNINITIIETW